MIPYILQSISWPIMRIFFGVFCDFKVKGLEHLNNLKESGVIFASNHRGELDPIVVTGAVPFFSKLRPMYYVAREKSFYNPTFLKQAFYGGLFFKMWGAYPAFPGQQDYAFALSHHLIFLRKNRSICIFPEGKITVSNPEQHVEPKGGVAYLAEKTNSLIIPVLIKGTQGVSFFDFITFKVKITVVFGEVINPEELIKGEHKENAKMVMSKIYCLD